MSLLLIYYIFFITLFGGLVTMLGIPKYLLATVEVSIILLLLLSLISHRRTQIPNLLYSVFFFAMIGICSSIVNHSTLTEIIASIRLILRFYVFYVSLILLSLSDKNMRKINFVVMMLLLLQLPVVAVKFFIYGIAEKTMGAYTKAGSVTTLLPISLIFYLAGYYFFYQSKLKYILIGIGFVIFSIVGAKRAVAFLYPLQFLAIYYYFYKKGTGTHLVKNVGVFFVALSLIVVVSGSILYFNPTLNPERKVGGSVDPLYAIGFAKKYTTAEHSYGYTTGRVSTSMRIWSAVWDSGLPNIAFGFGPGSTTPSILDAAKSRARVEKFFTKLKIGYGLTSVNRITLEYGILGVVAYTLIPIVLVRMCCRYYKRESDPYWKAFAAGSVGFSFSMLFFFLAYSHRAFWGDTMPPLYFYAMAVVYTRLRQISSPPQRDGLVTLSSG